MNDKKLEYHRRYRRNHREEINARARKRYWDNHEKMLARRKAYVKSNLAKCADFNRRWKAKHPERIRALWRSSGKRKKRRNFAFTIDEFTRKDRK